jgi:hypothetical protein
VWLLDVDQSAAIDVVGGWISPSYGVKQPTSTVSSAITTRLPLTRRWVFSNVWLSDSERLDYVRSIVPPAIIYATDSSQ